MLHPAPHILPHLALPTSLRRFNKKTKLSQWTEPDEKWVIAPESSDGESSSGSDESESEDESGEE